MSRYITEVLKTKVREAAKNRCGYCQSSQKYVLGILEIEHIIPKFLGDSDEAHVPLFQTARKQLRIWLQEKIVVLASRAEEFQDVPSFISKVDDLLNAFNGY